MPSPLGAVGTPEWGACTAPHAKAPGGRKDWPGEDLGFGELLVSPGHPSTVRGTPEPVFEGGENDRTEVL